MKAFFEIYDRCADWYFDRYPPERGDEEGLYAAVAKPAEEAGELIGAYNKLRRARKNNELLHPAQLRRCAETAAREQAVEEELADVIVSAAMAAIALGINSSQMEHAIDRCLYNLERRPKNDPLGNHA